LAFLNYFLGGQSKGVTISQLKYAPNTFGGEWLGKLQAHLPGDSIKKLMRQR